MFLEKVLAGAFTLFTLFIMSFFVLWLVAEETWLVFLAGFWTVMFTIFYFKRS